MTNCGIMPRQGRVLNSSSPSCTSTAIPSRQYVYLDHRVSRFRFFGPVEYLPALWHNIIECFAQPSYIQSPFNGTWRTFAAHELLTLAWTSLNADTSIIPPLEPLRICHNRRLCSPRFVFHKNCGRVCPEMF